jgi:hypothetical protein
MRNQSLLRPAFEKQQSRDLLDDAPPGKNMVETGLPLPETMAGLPKV